MHQTSTDRSSTDRLLALARRNAETYIRNPKVKAIALVGSVARGITDEYSDIDMTVCCEEMLTEEERLAVMFENGGTDRFTLGDETGAMDQYVVDGITCQFGICPLSMLEEDIANVIDRYDTEHDRHVIIGGIRQAVPLYGDSIVEQLKSKAASYPDELVREMVRKHLSFRPLWFYQQRLAGRDDFFNLYQSLIRAERNILGVLLGLNRLYPEHDFKRLGRLIESMEIAPANLSTRLREILSGNLPHTFSVLDSLIRELFELVEQHVPEIDVEVARLKYEGVGGRRQV